MSYFRRSLGQPITDPSQLEEDGIVGTVTPTRVECEKLAPDSPWRKPGQVCAPTLMDWFWGLFKPSASPVAPSQPEPILVPVPVPVPEASVEDTGMSDIAKVILVGGAGIAAYYALRKKKRH